MLVAGVDIGSNATRLTVSKASKKGSFHHPEDLIEKYRFPCRLGNDVFKTGLISIEKNKKLHQIFSEITTLLNKHGVQKNYGVATSAFRDAENGEEIMKSLTKEHPKVNCQVITGGEEAKLMSEGLLRRGLFHDDSSHLHADIGGGSLELSFFHKGSFIFQESLDLGTLRILKSTECGILTDDYKEKLSSISKLLSTHLKNINLNNVKVHGTGGNFKRLGTLRKHSFNKTDESFVKKDELLEMIEEYKKYPGPELSNHTPIKKDNAALIIPSLLIIKEILKNTPSDRIEISKLSLSHVLLDKLSD